MKSTDREWFHQAGRSCFRALVVALLPVVPTASVFGQAAPVASEAPKEGAADPENTVVLSPFEVKADANGYFESNTMSGTRLNSKIEDLGQSITVMTKEQMTDFAMLDVNDVFDYMASTEGTGSYSDFALDRTGAVTDNVQVNPNNANRVRGIGNANIAFNNIATTGRVPVDPLWMDTLELSRGPNANIFGLGNAAGTVNQVPATANLTRDFAQLVLRADSYDGWRTSFDVNRILVKDKLALRASYARQRTGFVRKPSGEDINRLSVQVKAQPFKYTTVSGSWYHYTNNSVRPNFTTPRDYITDWIEAGQPAWNPITRLITIDGVTFGQGMVAGSTTPITTLPSYFVNNESRSIFRIGAQGEAPFWSMPQVTNASTPAAGGVNNNIRLINTGPSNSFFGATQPLFASTPPLSDKSLYDWENINLMANNRARDNVDIFLGQIDQIVINTQKQTLAAQFTFMREDVKRVENLPFGPASVNSTTGELRVDPNLFNLDGSPNPYFGRPYLRTSEPFLRDRPQLWETARAQAAYRVDFTEDEGWSKWIGVHQVLGYYEYKNQRNRHYAYRHTATNRDLPWLQAQADAGIPLANRTTGNNQFPASNNFMRVIEQFYVGNTPGGGVEFAPNFFPEGASLPFVWGNTGNFRFDEATIGWTPSPDGSGGNSSSQTVVKTVGGVLQSSFLKDRLVTTFGLREDRVFDRNAPFASLTPDLRAFDFAESNKWNDGWRKADGRTKSASVVARPFRNIRFLDAQVRDGSGIGRFFAEAVSGLSLTYNRSDNFIATGPAVDLFLNPLPNQTGKSKDVGLWLNLLGGKLSVRYTHFKTNQLSFRDGDINTIAQRVLRADGLNAADPFNLQDRSTEWITELNPTWTEDQVKAEVARTMGLTQEQIDGLEAAIASGTLAAPQDIIARGDELEINYNPTRAWTVSASVTKTASINQNAGGTIEEWINQRMPIWTSVEDPRFTQASPGGANLPVGATGHLLWREIFGANFTAFNYNGTNSAATNFVTFVEGPLSVFRQLEGRPRPEIRKYSAKFNTKYNLSGISDNKILKNVSVGGSLRWLDNAAIGFAGKQSLPDKITALDTNKPIYSPTETFVDLFITYRTKLFGDKVRASFQLNVKNVGEGGGGLRATKAFPDGTALAYRIIDPRQFILSTTFDF